jgi:hypothetical protein
LTFQAGRGLGRSELSFFGEGYEMEKVPDFHELYSSIYQFWR